jgi:hypothetical protein
MPSKLCCHAIPVTDSPSLPQMVSAVCVHSANDQTGGCASAAPWVKTLLAAFSRDRGLIAASPSVPARIVASALVAEFASTGADKVTALRQIARDVGHEEGGAAFIERSGAPVVCASLRSKCEDQRLYASLILLRMASEGAQQGPFLASLACERSIAGLHAGKDTHCTRTCIQVRMYRSHACRY